MGFGTLITLGNLFALAEAYPDLKTNQTFLQLQSRISGLENGIAVDQHFGDRLPKKENFRAGPRAGWGKRHMHGVFFTPFFSAFHFRSG